jgi:glycosyltransferase involved in cell wall biosynthesis
VYHLHDPELLPAVPLLKRATDAGIIYDIHEDIRSQISRKSWIHDMAKPIVKKGYSLFEKTCLPLVDEVIVAEESYQTRYYKDASVVRNYPKIKSIPESTVNRDCSIVLAYVGLLSPRHGIKQLVEAIAFLSKQYDISMLFIGNFSSASFEKQIQETIRRFEISSSVTFTGRLPSNQAIRQVASADIGFATLHKEPNFVHSLPTKMFEYMMCRIPVVVSNVDLWESIVLTNECGLTVEPTARTEIIEATQYLIEHPEERERLGKNGRAAIESEYRWEQQARVLLQVYNKLTD